eukprot:CAMPEP_0173354262 /NCGR_PEP_ID=MMETSP1144-20121109/17083_1 /TAXON_ID=483371 /ORGANISM="non described non described, Strain CCMP2298" /LENGTH=217 /DNA_ID=CAMNT_0014302783 /DNA_START=118 /DNA_END=768 /DNA_ORIENTATION=+
MTSVTSPAMSRKTILWFRNDLRISDNPMLNLVASRGQQQQKQQSHQQHQSQQQPQLQQQQQPQNTHETHDLLCVYCFDPRTYATRHSPHKTGIYRAQFIIQSVENLRSNLRSIGCELLVSTEQPEVLIPTLLRGIAHSDVLVQAEITSEERGVERRVQRGIEGLKGVHKLHRIIGGDTLYHPADLPPAYVNPSHISDIFSLFRAEVEKSCRVRPSLP